MLAAADNLGGETSLHLAAKNGSENVLRFLLAAGCWVETKDADQRTPLASACAGGRIGTAAMLLSGNGWGLEKVPEGEISPPVRCDSVWCGPMRYGAVRCGAVRCGAVRCGAEILSGKCVALWAGDVTAPSSLSREKERERERERERKHESR